MIDILKKFSYLLDRREKIQVIGLFVLLLMGGFLEMLGVGFVVPFISLISNPQLIEERENFKTLYTIVGSPSVETFFLYLGMAYIAIYLLKNSYLGIMFYLQYKFIFDKQRKLANKLYYAYISAPYTFHLERNTAQLLRNLGPEINQAFLQVLIPFVQLATEVNVMTGIIILLIIIEPIASLITASILGVASFCFYRFFRKKVSRSGQSRQYHQGKLIQQINQGLGGVKETKLLGREHFFLTFHNFHRQKVTEVMRFNQTLQQIPRLYFETIAVSGLLGIVIVTLIQGRGMQGVLPSLSLFAVAAFRIMPSLNRMVNNLNKIRFGSYALNLVESEFRHLEKQDESHEISNQLIENCTLQNKITLQEVFYYYPNQDKPALQSISLEILKGTSVGFVGSSGAGKTTLIDLILGLLEPTAGQILVDDKNIHQNIRSWQNQIGYIPQSIYLCDDTLKANIAFGIPKEEIIDEKIEQAVELAQLTDLVSQLPKGLDTVVGERGVRLSGGQRQRIGIARALYHNPEVIVMDEATAALDNQTEAGIMKAVEKLSGEKTLIMIAHRLSTVKNCDCLYFLESGQILDTGTYHELCQRNAKFQVMAGIKK